MCRGGGGGSGYQIFGYIFRPNISPLKVNSHTSVPARHRSVTSVTSQSKNLFYNGFPVALSTLIRLSSGAGPSVALPASPTDGQLTDEFRTEL
ncbi:hypothetical protein J6590_098786 [Homalodisca vitripennis]|nr:hypothetical protein J6590_098786 [Homalodisca vitripennis]